MPDAKARLLIVDDEPSIRTSLSCVLAEIGYRVDTAGDGFAALGEMRRQVPEILLSDLNMPGMSGFELLSVVRRRFPAIQTVAMSGAFTGEEVPSGVAADAFYQKGSSVGSLLRILETLPWPERMTGKQASAGAPIRVQVNRHEDSGEAQVTIACPECLRTYSQNLDGTVRPMLETACIHCHASIHCAIVEPAEPASLLSYQLRQTFPAPAGQALQRLTN
jgi:CheY-like chemotaxis protein